jgi:hypothetical protein
VQKRELSATLRDRSPPRELIKRSWSMPLSWARARKRFKPSSRRWICPSLPDVAASRAEHLFESEDVELMAQVWRLSSP